MLNLFGGDDSFDEERRRLDQLSNQIRQIGIPLYDDLIAETYVPETANYELMREDPVTKSMQAQALARMANLAETGLSEEDAAGFAKAGRLGAQQSRAGREAAIMDAQNRGVSGSGLEFAMREIANQGGAERANMAGLEQAAQSARQRALYNQAYLGGLENQRAADARTNQANTNVINDFNMRNTTNRNQAAMLNQERRSDATQYNNNLRDRRFNNQMGQIDRQSGIAQQRNQVNSAERERGRQFGGALGAGLGYAIGGEPGAYIGGAFGRL